MKILVCGGAGYIGSHMVLMLGEAGHDVIVLDNLSTGHRDAVLAGTLVEGCLSDQALLTHLMTSHQFDAVMHFAGNIEVAESVQNPAKYYANNVTNTLTLLDMMVQHNVKQFIFSSTAAIFGEPKYTPMNEAHSKSPKNPYGQSKLMVEQVLKDYDAAYGLRSVSLRYFNAAGADPQARLGERHEPETHLIPLVLQAARGQRAVIKVFGTDYDTPDGTCIRDYIHVQDLCSAHLKALQYLASHGETAAFNLGNGAGYSVREVIEAAKHITGCDFPVVETERRPGDPAVLVADSTLARSVLSWVPKITDLQDIVKDAWCYMEQHSHAK